MSDIQTPTKSDVSKQTTLKTIIIGDSGVGKTNLLTRYCENLFKQNYVSTIGVDFKCKTIELQGQKIKLQIWDTAGQERFKNITQTYYKGAAGVILSYAINCRSSFTNINNWIKHIQSSSSEQICKVLIGTKSDLYQSRQVSIEEGQKIANKYNMPFLEISAKQGVNVNQTFMVLAQKMVQMKNLKMSLTSNVNSLTMNKPTKNKKCEC